MNDLTKQWMERKGFVYDTKLKHFRRRGVVGAIIAQLRIKGLLDLLAKMLRKIS
jgi:hypothetical protein